MKAHHILPSARNSPSSGHGVRSRTSKACDRCRLKKIKCDGATRCLRCQGDNAICIYGDRKKAHDKVYPKGYAQLLQQQQRWLVNGIQKLYQCIQIGEGWPADPLKHETNNQPLTHDILTALGVLDPEQRVCSKGEHETPQQGLNEHMDECTQRSKTSPGPQGSIHIQPFPMPRDLNGFSPEDQLERGKFLYI
ncbi:Zn(II)2Cys6 transcription factor [Penicillium antarcticum]|uniref:Zn(II)2Cys6 transcription factor n=1 Tax=Penicillium antarcticum TaxID=416450 RepID=UPI00239DD637|nr:Zn(II)2Cys6 transcription factor [Penicillium antarcticum]KAJ5302393.1 Zn(II)2Cys6 transcription factor [Penicillium antarcticum]